MAAQRRAVQRLELHRRHATEARLRPALDRAERVGRLRARDERRDAAAGVRRVGELVGGLLRVDARALCDVAEPEGGAGDLVADAQPRAVLVLGVALDPLGGVRPRVAGGRDAAHVDAERRLGNGAARADCGDGDGDYGAGETPAGKTHVIPPVAEHPRSATIDPRETCWPPGLGALAA